MSCILAIEVSFRSALQTSLPIGKLAGLAFLRRLDIWRDCTGSEDAKSSRLAWVRDVLRYFENEFGADFYCCPDKAAINTERDNPSPAQCRKILDFYQTVRRHIEVYFIDLKKPIEKDLFSQLPYRHLVAAYCSMAVRAALDAQDRFTAGNSTDRPEHRLYSAYSLSLKMKEMFGVAWSYVDYIEDGKLDAELEGIGWLSHEEIQEVWWMLILRGFMWGFSKWFVVSEENDYVVPSSLFGTKTPL